LYIDLAPVLCKVLYEAFYICISDSIPQTTALVSYYGLYFIEDKTKAKHCWQFMQIVQNN
jgi:hypothetical protein